MKPNLLILFPLTLFFIFVTGCQIHLQPEIKESFTSNESSAPDNWRQIAILPFSGNPAFRRVAAEWVSFHLGEQKDIQILEPALVEITLQHNGILLTTDGQISIGSKEAGKALNADGVLTGNLTIRHGMGLQAILELALIDVQTNEIVAKSVKWGGWEFYWGALPGSTFGEYPLVVEASEKGAKDMLTILRGEVPKSKPSEDWDYE